MKKYFVVLLLVVIVTPSLIALPRFSLITGARCGACHVNPTGGQLRTEYGTTFSITALPLRSTDVAKEAADEDTAGAVEPEDENVEAAGDTLEGGGEEEEFSFNPRLTENITIGADFRGQFIYDREPRTTTFHAMSMWLYGGVQLGKKVTLYFKQDILNPTYGLLSGPEIYSILRPQPSWYIKGGVFLPDYGMRLDDHTVYTRSGDIGFIQGLGMHPGLIFVPNYKDVGIEGGWAKGGLFVTAGLFNGTGNSQKINFSTDKAYAGKAEFMGDAGEGTHYRIGASTYGFKDFHMNGLFAGIGIENAAFYGEVDWTRSRLDLFSGYTITTGIQSLASFVALDYRVLQGVWLTGRYDILDPQLGREDAAAGSVLNGIKRLTLGGEFFPYAFVEVRPQYRINMETPSTNNDQLLVQFHYWY